MVKVMQNRVISVTALSNYIKSIFDAEMLLSNINVVGEISGWSYSGNNVFFTLNMGFENSLNSFLLNHYKSIVRQSK